MPNVPLLPDDAYVLGNPIIDAEHRRLLESIESLLNARSDADAEHAAETLVEVWRQHCVEEENLMEESHYPDIQRHKEIHQEFDGLLLYFLEQNLGRIMDGHQEVARFTIGWFAGHVAKCDGPLAGYLAAGCAGRA